MFCLHYVHRKKFIFLKVLCRVGRASLSLLGISLLFGSCSGVGTSTSMNGAVYTASSGGSTGSSASSTGTSGSSSSLSGAEILSLSNSGYIENIVTFVASNGSNGNGGSGSQDGSSVSRLSFVADDIGLPEGGSVILTVTVDGSTSTYTTVASEDGNVYFDIPAVASGSNVSVKMDIRNASNNLVLTGSASKTISANSANIALTLSDKVDVAVNAAFSTFSWVYRVSTDSGSTYTCYSGSANPSFKASLASTAIVDGLVLKGSVLYVIDSVSVEVDENGSVSLSSVAFTTNSGGYDISGLLIATCDQDGSYDIGLESGGAYVGLFPLLHDFVPAQLLKVDVISLENSKDSGTTWIPLVTDGTLIPGTDLFRATFRIILDGVPSDIVTLQNTVQTRA